MNEWMNDEMNDDKISSQQISRKNNVYYIHCIHHIWGGEHVWCGEERY